MAILRGFPPIVGSMGGHYIQPRRCRICKKTNDVVGCSDKWANDNVCEECDEEWDELIIDRVTGDEVAVRMRETKVVGEHVYQATYRKEEITLDDEKTILPTNRWDELRGKNCVIPDILNPTKSKWWSGLKE